MKVEVHVIVLAIVAAALCGGVIGWLVAQPSPANHIIVEVIDE